MLWNLAKFLLCSLAGICVGVSGDLLGAEPIEAEMLLAALILSPVVVTVGGNAVTIKWASPVFLVGGLMFIPVYMFLLWACVRKPAAWCYAGAFLWCAQGYFQVLHRFALVMSA